MSAGRRAAVAGASLVVIAAIVAVVVFGFVGIAQTVSAGTQSTVCGVTVGVTSTGQTVRLLGASDASLSPGDRVRLSALCVAEIVAVDGGAAPGDDGAGARVQLRWRSW